MTETVVSYKSKRAPQPTITDAKSALNHLYPYYNKKTIHLKEQVLLLLLNRAHMVLGVCKASEGGMSSSMYYTKLL